MSAPKVLRWSIISAAFVVQPALADDADDLRSILNETVVTTASTSAEKASTAPATSVTLTAEDLRVYGIRSLDEAINFRSVGVITSDPLRTPDIGARGVLYGAARFDQGAGIPLDVVDHIEVIVGTKATNCKPALECLLDEGCFESANFTDRINCGLPCLQAHGVLAGNDPATTALGQINVCIVASCKKACFVK